MKILVTGGAGFIGSAFIRHILHDGHDEVINIDKLTYASNLESLSSVSSLRSYNFERMDIADSSALSRVFREHRPEAVVHLAAESHVDRSIDGPSEFIHTNIIGTYALLEVSYQYWRNLGPLERDTFRFHHVSTDEVYGDLGETGVSATEESAYRPSSPYSASKAASDHLVRAWHRTYGLPTIITNCSNNYGPHQFPEKLIPLMILNAVEGKPLPIFGRGEQVRDWLYVDDHARALELVLRRGRLGQTYNIGGGCQIRNIDLAKMVCNLLEQCPPSKPEGISKYAELIKFVQDRPGHDHRYSIDCRKLGDELGWVPQHDLARGLRATIKWYLENLGWCDRALHSGYSRARLGLRGVSR